MVCFQTKNSNLGKYWRALESKRLVYSVDIWYILWPFGDLEAIWYIFPRFGILCPEKSGNPSVGCVSPNVYQSLPGDGFNEAQFC
jgi:hypothetical protein